MNEAIIRSEGVLSGSIVSEGILRGSLSMPVGYGFFLAKVNFGGDTLIDLTNDSVDAASLLKGKTAHNAAGEQIVGEVDDGTEVAY